MKRRRPRKYVWVRVSGSAWMGDAMVCKFPYKGIVQMGDMVYLDKLGYCRLWYSELKFPWLGQVVK